jgi:hypothetical protein
VARAVAESQASHAQAAPDPNNAWAAALAGLGVLDQQPGDQLAHLWPDNVLAWNCWQGVQTQWRVGMGGATGLDYAGVRAFLDEQQLPADERRGVFSGIQACDRATLDVWAEQRERDQADKSAPRPPVPGR